MQYIIAIVTAVIIVGLMLLTKYIDKKYQKNNSLIKIVNQRIIPCCLIVVFIVRLFCYQTLIDTYIGLDSSIISKPLTVLSLIAIWFEYAIILLVILRSFYSIKVLNNIIKWISIPVLVANIALLTSIVTLFQGSADLSVLTIILPIELGLGLGISIYYLIQDIKTKNTYLDILKMFGIFACLLIPALPGYFAQFMFGHVVMFIDVKGISFAHRLILYGAVIIPMILYFTLRGKSQEVKRFALIYICLAVLVGFLVNYDYTTLANPWDWPFHLCNTALFILPLVLIFKMKRLFYFTYFINVVGALLAMLMPNYDTGTNIMSMRVFTFWFNHYIAFFMPLLIVALGEFEKPKIKQFYYSMVGFLAYYLLVLGLNVYFTALGKNVDYFFINSDFVGEKLGNWAEKLFNITATINVGELKLEFHPLYQVLFFIVYVGIGFATWFVYEEFFRIAASHHELAEKLRKIKLDEFALEANLQGRSITEPMNKDAGVKYELKHFSKKYSSSKVYAVKDANLEVFGGEIFGFLGPNGAGKSTIIKTTVGIQPITEGSIEINGYDVKSQSVAAKRNIGYVPDHYALYEKLTGREYVNYIADIYDVSLADRNERIEKYIRLFELSDAIDRKISTYSHGMKQKITIMSALVHNPKIWILDEPLTGLDPNSIFQVKECMKEHAAAGNVVFFSSHIIDIVEKLCERIAIIKKGRILCVKTVKEIEETGQTLEEFYLNAISDKPDDGDSE